MSHVIENSNNTLRAILEITGFSHYNNQNLFKGSSRNFNVLSVFKPASSLYINGKRL